MCLCVCWIVCLYVFVCASKFVRVRVCVFARVLCVCSFACMYVWYVVVACARLLACSFMW